MNISSVFGLPFSPKIHCSMYNTWRVAPQLLDHNPCLSNHRRGMPSPSQPCQHVCVCVCVCINMSMCESGGWFMCRWITVHIPTGLYFIYGHICFCVCVDVRRGVTAGLRPAHLSHTRTHTQTRTLLHPLAGLDDEVGE